MPAFFLGTLVADFMNAYLQKHFVNKPAFAVLVGVSVDRLDQLLALEAIPGASYACTDHSVHSCVFGTSQLPHAPEGEYFRPECVRWAKLAAAASPGSERAAVLAVITQELEAALHDMGQGSGISVQALLPHFWNGTFGLCVADPSNGAAIVRKETLQQRLSDLTKGGAEPRPTGIARESLLQLVDDYAASAMPFSPVEYARSSRKRLVDDLRPLVARAGDLPAPA